MCSEKEIKERIHWLESQNLVCQDWVAHELRTLFDYHEKCLKPTDYEKKWVVIQIKKMLENYGLSSKDLEGPPRYSIDELEKILKEFYKEIKQIKPTAENSYCDYSHAQITLEVKRFLQILKKNPKKVEEILNVRKKKS